MTQAAAALAVLVSELGGSGFSPTYVLEAFRWVWMVQGCLKLDVRASVVGAIEYMAAHMSACESVYNACSRCAHPASKWLAAAAPTTSHPCGAEALSPRATARQRRGWAMSTCRTMGRPKSWACRAQTRSACCASCW